jgi:predicted RNase H-related nuclease YkuK (DUF458 family)
MTTFKKFDGTEVTDISKYVIDYTSKNHVLDVTVGTDSKQRKYSTCYISVICLHTQNGTHVIYSKENTPKVKDLFTRLWGEVERSKNIADVLKPAVDAIDTPRPDFIVHVDINPLENAGSNIAHQAAVGYITGVGYKVEAKPNAAAATCAADKLLQHTSARKTHRRTRVRERAK